jgi:hypothetical protein
MSIGMIAREPEGFFQIIGRKSLISDLKLGMMRLYSGRQDRDDVVERRRLGSYRAFIRLGLARRLSLLGNVVLGRLRRYLSDDDPQRGLVREESVASVVRSRKGEARSGGTNNSPIGFGGRFTWQFLAERVLSALARPCVALRRSRDPRKQAGVRNPFTTPRGPGRFRAIS